MIVLVAGVADPRVSAPAAIVDRILLPVARELSGVGTPAALHVVNATARRGPAQPFVPRRR
jgi:hypothetical protein